jgi:hypothetical protein
LAPGMRPRLARARTSSGCMRKNAAASLRFNVFTTMNFEPSSIEQARAVSTTTGGSRIPLEPIQDVGSQPANSFAGKALYAGELCCRFRASERPRRPPHEASDVMGGQYLVPYRVGVICLARQENPWAKDGYPEALGVRSNLAHKRPATCGSGRLGSNCHVCVYVASHTSRKPAEIRGEFSETELRANAIGASD